MGKWREWGKRCKWGKRDKRINSNQESLCKGPKRRLQRIMFWYPLRGPKSDQGGSEVGLVWLGLAWFGLVWFGLVWFGLAWLGFSNRTQKL